MRRGRKALVGVGGTDVECKVGVAAGDRVSGTWGVIKMIGHVAYAAMITKFIEPKFTRMGPRRGPSENIAAGGSTAGAVNGFGRNSRSEELSHVEVKVYTAVKSDNHATIDEHKHTKMEINRVLEPSVHVIASRNSNA